ncbi:MAG: chorismate-binding protein, partial [Bacteroidales bacterium]
IKRGNTPEEDVILKNILFNDPKERSENVMIVDLVRNDLSRSAGKGSVKVEELFGIYTYPRVHQMISTVTSTLKNKIHFVDAIRMAFPMGSMTGAPKIRAMELIEQYEDTQRGLYSGAVGYIKPGKDFDFNVIIRSLLYNNADNFLSFMAGSAITIESVPEREYEECLLKAASMAHVIDADLKPQ